MYGFVFSVILNFVILILFVGLKNLCKIKRWLWVELIFYLFIIFYLVSWLLLDGRMEGIGINIFIFVFVMFRIEVVEIFIGG